MTMKRLSLLWLAGLTAAVTAARADTGAAPAVPPGKTRGAKLYAQNCASCHMADGNGIPNIQPGLVGSPVVAGDPATVIKVLLEGPAAALPPPRPHYDNPMPAFAAWKDADIAAVATFIRQKFGAGAPPVTPAQVAAARAAK